MSLHVLIVEDDEDFVEELREIFSDLPGESEVRIARSRDEAYEILEHNFLDLVVLDLRIPTVAGALDADPEHGHAVFGRTRTAAPGTPILVLTGSPAEDFVPEMLKNHQRIDIWGEGYGTDTVLFLRKCDIDECSDRLLPIARAIEHLSSVELEAPDVDLEAGADRLLRIFARKFQGVRCRASELRSGLSGARVIRLCVTDRQGALLHDAVAKLSSHADVREEGRRYDLYVTRLSPSATPRKLATLEYGAKNLAGVFFGLARGSDESAFDLVSRSPQEAKATIRSVEQATADWIAGVPETRMTIRQIRQRLVSDRCLGRLSDSFGLDWVQEFEEREIQVRLGCIHGDLHGKNIFVSSEGTKLIDYADVGDGPASLDPVTLELSWLFHPDAPGAAGVWPATERAEAWGNLEAYLDGCPFAEFVQECRAWALRAAAGSREVAASAYSYLVRQLRYEDTDKDRARALLAGVRSFFDGST